MCVYQHLVHFLSQQVAHDDDAHNDDVGSVNDVRENMCPRRRDDLASFGEQTSRDDRQHLQQTNRIDASPATIFPNHRWTPNQRTEDQNC